MEQAIDYGFERAMFYRPRVCPVRGVELVDELCERIPLHIVENTESLTKYEVAE